MSVVNPLLCIFIYHIDSVFVENANTECHSVLVIRALVVSLKKDVNPRIHPLRIY